MVKTVIDIYQQSFYTRIPSSTLNSSTGLPIVTLKSNTLPLTLRTFLPEDVSTLTSFLSNPENTKHDLSIAEMSTTEKEALVHQWTTQAPSSPLSQFNFMVLENGKPVGITGYGWIGPCRTINDRNFVRGEEGLAGAVGIGLNSKVRRKGYGYEVLRISIDYGLRDLGMEEIRLNTTSKNLGMKELMEKKFWYVEEEEVQPDKFGNNLLWRFQRGDLKLLNDG